MSSLRYRFRIYDPGSTSLSTGNVDVTFDHSRLKEAPTVLGSVVRPREGRTEAQPWYVDITDVASTFTAQLADSSGRLDLLNRIAVLQRSIDGGTYSNIGVGRISDVFLNPDIASYRLTIEDERVLERRQTIFNSTNTTQIYPPGPFVAYGGFAKAPKSAFTPQLRDSGNNSIYKIVFFTNNLPFTDGAIKAIERDVVQNPEPSTEGNFTHLRFNYGGTDYPVVSFDTVSDMTGFGRSWTQGLKEMGNVVSCWIAASSSEFTLDNTYSSGYLHMMSAPPSPETPLHIGGVNGLHPMQIARNIYNGSYSTAATGIRYSTAAWDNGTTGLLKTAMPSVRFRITGPAVMSEWLEDNLYATNGVIPFTDSSGRIAPRCIRLPNSTSGITFSFTGANLTEHPTWAHPRREQVTVANVEFTNETPTVFVGAFTGVGDPQKIKHPEGGADYITATPYTREIQHDRVTQFGRQVANIKAHGIHSGDPYGDVHGGWQPSAVSFEVQRYLNFLQPDIFNRFGDGPVMGTFASHTTGESVSPGDVVKMTLGTFPNHTTGTRGGTRFVQIMSKDITPTGPRFTYLDGGLTLTPLAAPTISLSSSTSDPKHTVRATIGSLAAGARLRLEVAQSTSIPAAGSTLWQPWQQGITTGVYNIGRRPSNTMFWARVAATKENRLASAWRNSTVGKTTQAIAAPSSFAGSSVSAGTVLGTWTNNDTRYKVAVHGDTSTSATFSTANQLTILPAGSNRFRFEGLQSTTKYLLGVRYRDDYGGYSARSAAAVTTTSAVRTCPSMLAMTVFKYTLFS